MYFAFVKVSKCNTSCLIVWIQPAMYTVSY